MKATEQCFPACCIVYYSEQAKVFLTFNFLTSVDEILKCDFNWKLLSGTFLLYVYYAVHGGSSLWAWVQNLITQSQTVDHYVKGYKLRLVTLLLAAFASALILRILATSSIKLKSAQSTVRPVLAFIWFIKAK